MPDDTTDDIKAAIALGSNLGNREANLREAMQRMEALGKVTAVSSFHDTAPVGYLDQPRFLNAAALLKTELPPLDLLHALLEIERHMGRDRSAAVPAKGPRLIDLDLLLYGDEVLQTPELILPHPTMHERGFVLAPLAEIAPHMRHPILHMRADELFATYVRYMTQSAHAPQHSGPAIPQHNPAASLGPVD